MPKEKIQHTGLGVKPFFQGQFGDALHQFRGGAIEETLTKTDRGKVTNRRSKRQPLPPNTRAITTKRSFLGLLATGSAGAGIHRLTSLLSSDGTSNDTGRQISLPASSPQPIALSYEGSYDGSLLKWDFLSESPLVRITQKDLGTKAIPLGELITSEDQGTFAHMLARGAPPDALAYFERNGFDPNQHYHLKTLNGQYMTPDTLERSSQAVAYFKELQRFLADVLKTTFDSKTTTGIENLQWTILTPEDLNVKGRWYDGYHQRGFVGDTIHNLGSVELRRNPQGQLLDAFIDIYPQRGGFYRPPPLTTGEWLLGVTTGAAPHVSLSEMVGLAYQKEVRTYWDLFGLEGARPYLEAHQENFARIIGMEAASLLAVPGGSEIVDNAFTSIAYQGLRGLHGQAPASEPKAASEAYTYLAHGNLLMKNIGPKEFDRLFKERPRQYVAELQRQKPAIEIYQLQKK